MIDVVCLGCGWVGWATDLVNDAQEDADGDLQGEVNACPECGGDTEEVF